MNPFLRNPQAHKRTPVRAELPETRTSGTVATLRLYDPIDSWGEFWGISAKEFTAALDELPDTITEIELLINSPGGEVWEALAILNSLRRHKARVVAIVEGIAASSASFIAAGVDELRIVENAQFFIHKAWGMCVGNEHDMTRMAADLAHEDRNIASIYASKAGRDVDSWLADMSEETWFSADEAVTAGLANSVIPAREDTGAQNAMNRFDLSALSRKRATTNSSAAEAEANQKEGPMATLQEALAERLGTAVDADEDTLIAALDEALEEQTTTPTGAGAGTETDLTPEQVANYASQHGLVVVDRAQHEDYIAAATEGRAARAQQIREADEALVDGAIRAGKFGPARRDHWLNSLRADRDGATEAINGLAAGLVPLDELGHNVDPEQAGPTDFESVDKFKNWMEN
ncbi:head maturation protease, ClpP-related [Prescottella equi]|uniref:Clp protease family protein n=1 Tax=Rhodococcus phage REQ2 TaxID=1109713 RepID=G9FH29_9CAUD|nr:head maturation protease, ClpP-related [Prescottella equi]YP_005087048.1 head maturation protease [Rhodococcus phage REQ2]AEV51858.1 clp protease family protein [Rhodococcus phage REQ2]